MKVLKILLALSIFTYSGAHFLVGAEATTPWVGFVTIDIEGKDGSADQLSIVGLGLVNPVEFQGVLTGVNGVSLSLDASLTDGQFNAYKTAPELKPAYYVEFLSGPDSEGMIVDIVSNGIDSIEVAQDVSSTLSGTESFVIREESTLGSVFGVDNSAGLLGGTSAGSADEVLLFNPTTKNFTSYFYKSGGLGGTGWRKAGSNDDQSNQAIYPDEGVLVKRKTTGDLSFKHLGISKVWTGVGTCRRWAQCRRCPVPG